MHAAGRSWLLLTGCVLFYVIYLLFGALVFSCIERPVEEKVARQLQALKQEVLNQSCVNAASLDLLLAHVLQANKYGVSVFRNESSPSNWDLVSSMFFANTLVTTIGYGHTTPLSDTGKAFSIVYALIGVPFTMLVLTVCVQKLMYPLVLVPVGVLQRSGLDQRHAAVVHFILLLLGVILGFFLVPAAVFNAVEASWSFLDGVYFSFISLCTIGLGDFVPAMQSGQKNRPVYQICVMAYLFLGLMMMYLLLRTFHKMADLHGLTTFLQLPRCEDSDPEDDREPMVENGPTETTTTPQPKRSSHRSLGKPLEPGSQPSYNSITGN